MYRGGMRKDRAAGKIALSSKQPDTPKNRHGDGATHEREKSLTMSNNKGALRKNASFQALWVAGAFSTLGAEIIRIATPLAVLAATGSPLYAGIVGGMLVATMLLTQISAGVLVDSRNRRRILRWAQVGQLGNAAALLLVMYATDLVAVPLAIYAVIEGVCQAFLRPSREVAIRAIVPTEQLPSAFAQEEARLHVAKAVGPAISAGLFGAMFLLPFGSAIVGFSVAAILTVLARVPAWPESRTGQEKRAQTSGQVAAAREALSWLLRQSGLREFCAVLMVMNCLGGAFLVPLLSMQEEAGVQPAQTGLVLSSIGIGGIIGATISGHATRLLRPGLLAALVPMIFGACLCLATLPLGDLWPMVPIFLFSITTPFLNVASATIVAQLVPHDMLGRVGALLTVSGYLLAPLGPVLGGGIATAIGGSGALLVVGALLTITGIVAIGSRRLRELTAEIASAG